MLIPLHLIPPLAEEPASLGEPGHALGPATGLHIAPGWHLGDLRALGSPLVGAAGAEHAAVRTADLLRFAQLMADAGQPINPTRMLYDRRYAFVSLAEGRATAHDELATLSLELFEAYQAAGEWIGLAH